MNLNFTYMIFNIFISNGCESLLYDKSPFKRKVIMWKVNKNEKIKYHIKEKKIINLTLIFWVKVWIKFTYIIFLQPID